MVTLVYHGETFPINRRQRYLVPYNNVSLDVNVMGVKYLLPVRQAVRQPKMIMYVSTAFVSGDNAGVILEKPIRPGESLREGIHLDIDTELHLVNDTKKSLSTAGGDAKLKDMKELDLRRARHLGWSNTYIFTKVMGEMALELHRGRPQHGHCDHATNWPSIITSVTRCQSG